MDNNICVPLYSLWYFKNLLKCPQNTLARIAIEAGKTLLGKNKYIHVRDLNLSHRSNYLLRDFPRSPMVKTPCSQCKRQGVPGLGIKIPTCCMAWLHK